MYMTSAVNPQTQNTLASLYPKIMQSKVTKMYLISFCGSYWDNEYLDKNLSLTSVLNL